MNRGITVVIPTINRENYLVDTINDLLAQDHHPFEILIVDQSENISCAIKEMTSKHPNIINHHHVNFSGLPLARNYGWQHARFPIIVYIDDDIRCGPDFLTKHLQSFISPDIGVVAGGIDEPNRSEIIPKKVGKFRRWTATPIRGFSSKVPQEVDTAPGGNFSTNKTLLEELGGFDETLNTGAALYEETEFCLRVKKHGLRIVFNPKARLTHLVATTGGCRVPDVKHYIWSLCHNRSILIFRHLDWYYRFTAIVRLLILVLSYTRHSRNPSVLTAGINGFLQGWKKYQHSIFCTDWKQRSSS